MSPQSLTGAAVVLALIALATIAIVWWRKRYAARTTSATLPPHPTAPPQTMLVLLANAINNLNHEMRSCEIGEWFISRLAAQAMTRIQGRVYCNEAMAALSTQAVADAVPGANDVTRAEVARSLRVLVNETTRRVCGEGGMVTGADLADGLREALVHCTAPSGQLLTLYPLKSRVQLPA